MTYAPFLRANPTSVTVVAGTLVSGSISDTYTMLDGNIVQASEEAATPGLDLRFNFTGLQFIPDALVLRVHYDGDNVIRTLLYDYDDTAWVDVDTIIITSDYYIVEAPFPPESRFVSSGAAILRIGCAALGDVTNDIYFDYVSLWHRPFPPVTLYT
jgi:hypothetical protein